MASNYNPPAQFNVAQGKSSDVAAKKRDPRYIKLQQVEHEITEFNLLKLYVTIISLIILVKLFMAAIIDDDDYYAPNSRLFEVIVRLLQLIGYAFGLQAHLSKDYNQGRYFFAYLVLSFGLVIYQLVTAIKGDSSGPSVSNVILVSCNFIFNIFLTFYTYKFVKKLKERDEIKKTLEVQFEP